MLGTHLHPLGAENLGFHAQADKGRARAGVFDLDNLGDLCAGHHTGFVLEGRVALLVRPFEQGDLHLSGGDDVVRAGAVGIIGRVLSHGLHPLRGTSRVSDVQLILLIT